uniref:Uncharacterized protein n=1 Tax=Haptolina brevifila TaxID=156173 RepID=A0A7S2ND58_9EUKA
MLCQITAFDQRAPVRIEHLPFHNRQHSACVASRCARWQRDATDDEDGTNRSDSGQKTRGELPRADASSLAMVEDGGGGPIDSPRSRAGSEESVARDGGA